MAGLVAVYANKIKVHDEFQSYNNNSAFNYVTYHLRSLYNRGKGSLKYTFFKDGKQKIISGPYESSKIANKIKDVNLLKGTGLVTKINYKKLKKSLSTTSIDGYFINKENLDKGQHEERFNAFDEKFSKYVAGGNYNEAIEFSNSVFNGSLIKETEDGIIGLRTATGYKQLFLMNFSDDENDFTTLSSEDCIKVPFINQNEDVGEKEFQGMDTNTRALGRGELVKIDKDGVHSYESKVDSSGTGEEIKPGYDPHEPIYMLHKNSTWEGNSVLQTRKSIGENMYKLHKDLFHDLDMVGYVPDEPIDMAIGFQKASGIVNEEILQKDRYNLRYPQRSYGDRGQSKLSLMSEDLVKGKNLVIIDDSIVEGNHLRTISKLMKNFANRAYFISAELPIISEEQVGFYSESRDLIARDLSVDMGTISEFNYSVSEWADMNIFYNTPENLERSLRVKKEDLQIPDSLKYKN